MLLDVRARPVGKVLIQQTLIAAIETAVLYGKLCDLVEGLHAGSVHKDAGVEAVGPADIRSGGEFLTFEQLVAVFQHLKKPRGNWRRLLSSKSARTTYQRVGVEEDTLLELYQAPAMQLCEGHTQFGSLE